MFSERLIFLIKRLLTAAIIGGLALGVVGLIIPKTYTSSASLLFPGSSGSGGTINPAPETSGLAIGSQSSGGGGSTDQPSLSLLQGVLSVPQPGTSPGTAGLILKSRKSVVRLINEHGLEREWRLPIERSVDRFQKRFVCKAGTSGDLRIDFTDRSPERSQQVVASAIDLLTRSVEELSLDPAARNREFLRQGVMQADEDYRRAEAALVEFQRAAGGVPPDTQLQSFSQIYGDIQNELVNAEVEAAVSKSNAAATRDIGEKMLGIAQDPTGSDKALLNILYQDLVNRESEMALLKQKFTDKRPEVVQARQAVEVARGKVREEIARQSSGLKSGASPFVKDAVLASVVAGARADGLRKAEKRLSERLRTLPEAQARYQQLQSNLRDERTRLSLVRSEYVKAELIAQSRGPQFVIMDPPDMPQRPNGYRPVDYALIGLIVGPLFLMAKAGLLWMRQGIRLMSSGS